MSAEAIRWSTDVDGIPNKVGVRVRVLAKDVRSLTEFVYVIAKDGDGRHYLSTDGTLEGELPLHLAIAWRMEMPTERSVTTACTPYYRDLLHVLTEAAELAAKRIASRGRSTP